MTKNKFSGGKSQIKFVLLLSVLFIFLAFFVLSFEENLKQADAKTIESGTGKAASDELEWFEDDPSMAVMTGNKSHGLADDASRDDVTLSPTDGQELEVGNNGKVFLEGKFLDHDILKITVGISDIGTPVLGLAFHLKYDPLLLSFLRYDPGDFLERGGDPFYLVESKRTQNSGVSENTSADIGSGNGADTGGIDGGMDNGKAEETGEIIYGETLRRDASFPVGEGVISVFYFQQVDAGEDSGELVGDDESSTNNPENAEDSSAGSSGVKYEFHFANGVVSTLDTVRQDISGIKFVDLVLGAGESSNQDKMGGVFGDNVLGSLGNDSDSGSTGSIYGTLSFWLFVVVFISIGCAIFYFVKSYFAKSKFRNKICDLP